MPALVGKERILRRISAGPGGADGGGPSPVTPHTKTQQRAGGTPGIVLPALQIDNPLPRLTTASPNTLASGAGDTTVTLTGTGFMWSSRVNFDATVIGTTTIAAGSDGNTLPQGTINVASAVQFPQASGTLLIQTTLGLQTVNYTGTTGTTFTGCTGGTGVIHTGWQVTSSVVASPTSMTVIIPAAQLAVANNHTLAVVNLTPDGGTSNTVAFTVTGNLPQPSRVSGTDFPADNPAAQAGWDTWTPSVAAITPVGAPMLSEITRTATANDVLAITGDNFSSGMVFQVFGQTAVGNSILGNAGSPPLVLDTTKNNANAVIASGQLPKSMYLVWPVDVSNNYGLPLAVNKTEAWAAFFTPAAQQQSATSVVAGETCQVIGRNLSTVDNSTTSLTVATGAQTLVLTGTDTRNYAAGQNIFLNVSTNGNLLGSMAGTVTSWTQATRTLVVNITATTGSGTYTAWDVCNCWIYFKLSGSGGQFVAPSAVNAYYVAFPIPTTAPLGGALPNGTYEVWLHNGHGGQDGWSGPPLTVSVVAADSWTTKVINLDPDYVNANPGQYHGKPYEVYSLLNGGVKLDMMVAIKWAVGQIGNGGPARIRLDTGDGASGGTYYFDGSTAGSHYITALGGAKPLWINGAGKTLTTLLTMPGFSADLVWEVSHGRITDLKIDTTGATITSTAQAGQLAFGRIENVTIVARGTGPTGQLLSLSMGFIGPTSYVKNLTLTGPGMTSSAYGIFDTITYYGTDSGEAFMYPSGSGLFINWTLQQQGSLVTHTSTTSLTPGQGPTNIYFTLAVSAGNNAIVSSSSRPFTGGDVGSYVHVLSGAPWVPGYYLINSVDGSNNATLASSPGPVNTTGGHFEVAPLITFTTQTGLTDIAVGDQLRLYGPTAGDSPASICGQVVSYTSGTGVTTMVATQNFGSGVGTSWTFNSTKIADYAQGRVYDCQNSTANNTAFVYCQSNKYSKEPGWGDMNKGENVLAEGQQVFQHTVPTAVTSTSVTMGANIHTISTLLYVTDGKGAGQTRRISSSSGKVANISVPWTVQPDTTTSKIVENNCMDRIAIHKCRWEGNRNFNNGEFGGQGASVGAAAANTGFQFQDGMSNVQIDDCTFKDLHGSFSIIHSGGGGISPSGFNEPIFFCLFTNITLTGCANGIRWTGPGTAPRDGQTFVVTGVIVRNVTGALENSLGSGSTYVVNADQEGGGFVCNAMDKCTFSGTQRGFFNDLNVVGSSYTLTLYNTSITGSGAVGTKAYDLPGGVNPLHVQQSGTTSVSGFADNTMH